MSVAGTKQTSRWTLPSGQLLTQSGHGAHFTGIDRQPAAVIVTQVPSGPLDFPTVALS